MIRLILGFFLLFGVAGTIDADQNIGLTMLCIAAATGVSLMYSGLSSIKYNGSQ